MIELDDAELESQLRQTFQRAAAPVQGAGVRQDLIRHQVGRRAARRRTRRLGIAALAAAAAAVVVVGAVALTDDGHNRVDTGPVATDPSTTSATTPTTPTTPATPTTATTVPTVPPVTGAPTTAPPATAVAPAPPAFPPETTSLRHGGMLWAVYLAAAPSDLDAAVRVAKDAGYQAGPGDVNCDEGARQVLGVPDNTMVVGLYFDTQAQATQARAAFEARGHHVAGVAHITVFCAD